MVRDARPLCTFHVIPTEERAIHSDRRRYRVDCVTCGVILHESTTGPLERIEDHLRRVSNRS